MAEANQKKVIRLLGVGFDAEDGHIRISKGDNYDVFMGSDESHEYIRMLIQDIEKALDKRGLSLGNITPGEFTALVKSLY